MASENTRDRLVEHATGLFHCEGFRAVGVDRVAADLGISKKTLYKQIRSKGELLTEVLDRCHDMAVRDFPDETDDAAPRERLRGIFEAQRVHGEAPGFSGCFFVNIGTEFRDPSHPAVRQARSHKNQLHGYVRRQAERAGASGRRYSRSSSSCCTPGRPTTPCSPATTRIPFVRWSRPC
ncbi:TetR/AcrR family transcriptional regulator [Streptomyces sp. NPDC059744]|uniref:TetR/AcrR family transcriptional regulator n=1 Tax=Streptomyces sp. NPDC059744 TaxID=3346929 RepID=UPI003664EEC6